MDFQSAKSFEKLRLGAFQPYHLYYICRHCRYKMRISNAFNAIYVDTVNTVFTPHSTLYKVSCKSHKHQCPQCQHSIKCIACFDLHIDSVDKKIPYSIHNSVALIFCINHLDMPLCPFELQCRF